MRKRRYAVKKREVAANYRVVGGKEHIKGWQNSKSYEIKFTAPPICQLLPFMDSWQGLQRKILIVGQEMNTNKESSVKTVYAIEFHYIN